MSLSRKRLFIVALICLAAILAVSFATSAKTFAADEETTEVETTEATESEPIDISDADISFNGSPYYTYTGGQITPGVTVTYEDTVLTLGIEYMLSYGDNVNVGSGSVTVIGIGSFTGEATAYFGIQAPTLDTVKKVYSRATQTAVRIVVNKVDCDGYMVYISSDSGFKSGATRLCKTYGANKTTVRFDDLKNKSGTYYIKTMAYKAVGGTTAYSEPVTTKISLAPTPTAVGLTKATTTKNSLSVKVSAGDGKNSGYKVWVSSNKSFSEGSTRFYKTYSGSSTSIKAASLAHPSTTYYVKTQAYRWYENSSITGDEGLYIYSEPVVTAITLTPSLKTVKPTFVNTTQTAVRIIVNQTEANGYKVWICHDKGFSESSSRLYKTYKNSATTVRFDDLVHKSGTYYIRTLGYKKYYNGVSYQWAYSSSVITKITLAPTVSTPSVTEVSTALRAVRIELARDTNASGYKIWICGDSSFASGKTRLIRTSSNTKTSNRFDNLAMSDHTYKIRVQSYKWFNNGVTTQAVYSGYNYVNAEVWTKKVLSTTTISQISGSIAGYSACGPTAATILVNAQKGAGWNKDNLILYSEQHGLNDQGSLRGGGGMTAPRVVELINWYSNGYYNARNIYDSSKNMATVLKEQIDSGKRALICVRYYSSISTSWSAGTHFVVVCGYEYRNGSLYFYYSDPYYTGNYDRGLLLESANVIATSMYRVCTKEPWACIVLD